MLKRNKHFETEITEKEELIHKFLEIEASRTLELGWISISEGRRDGSTTPHCTCMNAVVARHLMPSDGRDTTRRLGRSIFAQDRQDCETMRWGGNDGRTFGKPANDSFGTDQVGNAVASQSELHFAFTQYSG
jgi:hypothetical protein